MRRQFCGGSAGLPAEQAKDPAAALCFCSPANLYGVGSSCVPQTDTTGLTGAGGSWHESRPRLLRGTEKVPGRTGTAEPENGVSARQDGMPVLMLTG